MQRRCRSEGTTRTKALVSGPMPIHSSRKRGVTALPLGFGDETVVRGISPFKSQGVFSVDDSALIIRAKFTAKAGKHLRIKREAYQEVQKACLENGIHFPRKQVTVQIPHGG